MEMIEILESIEENIKKIRINIDLIRRGV